jgi:hypothetical protein
MDPDPDPAPLFSDFMDAKKIFIFLIFCEKREGFGAGFRSGSVPLTNGSGSGTWRPKNMRIQIWIPNTD